MGDYGIKVSKAGIDVNSANPEDLYFSSKYFNFKEKAADSFNFLTGSATELNGGINATVTTITVDATTNYSDTGVFSIYNGVLGTYEYIKYTSINSTQFLGCTRGYWGSTASSWVDNSDVNPALTKRTIYTHSLSYFPVAFCFAKNSLNNYVYALPFTGPLHAFYYYITSTTVEAILLRNGLLTPPSGNEDWTIYYHVMYDKIKS